MSNNRWEVTLNVSIVWKVGSETVLYMAWG